MPEFDNTNRIVGWKQTSKNGNTYLSLRITVGGKEYKGALFAETEKKSEKSPDYTGKVEVVTDSQNNGWETARKQFKPDTVVEPTEDDIDLSSIPF